ncbi:MAG: DUF4254 domain-containing protein [Pirellulales bacterium]
MIDVSQITRMHRETVERWHREPVDNPYSGLLQIACQQHSFNFLLWHEEDIARSPDVGDERIAQVKRAIDRYNQQRNDWIEKLDVAIDEHLKATGVVAAADARQNTETPGSAIDRLSIIALRIYHLEEQTQRTDATPEHIESVSRKLAVCLIQHDDLAQGLRELLDDLQAGRKRHRLYRQFKMYNDPALNPYLYQARQRVGAT